MKNIMLKLLISISIVLIMISCNHKQGYDNVDGMVAEATLTTTGIDVNTLMEKVENGDMILLIDVREPNEFNLGYIPGAVNIPRGCY